MSSSLLQLCLTCGGTRKLVTIEQQASLHALYEQAKEHFSTSSLELKHGFPPRVLEDSLDISLEQASVRNKDRVMVVVSSTNGGTTSSGTTSPQASQQQRRPQRAAAKAATDSFADTIRAQEAALKQQSSPKKKRRRTTTTTSSGASRPSPNNFPRNTGAGRRLADGAVVGTTSRKQQSTSSLQKWKNQDDVSVALMGALQHGGGGKVGQVLRGAMRNAVQNRYEASRAVVKVSAVQSKHYTLSESSDGRLHVEYSKGMEGRGMYTEEVDCIPRDALVAVLEAIYASDKEQRELLKPTTLAQLSPRVFWNLFREYPDCTTVEDALQSLLPNLDWTVYTKRHRTLSEKAKENLRQEEGDEENQNQAAAHEAVQAVEQAMDQLHNYDTSRRRDRAARAALSRLEPPDQDEWKLVTPTESDDDELKECVATSSITEPGEIQRILSILHSLNIHNWRQLANCTSQELVQATHVEESLVEQWLDHAQQQSVEEIMVEICDNRVEVVEILREEARSGTPKDLAAWKHMPDMLYESAPSLANVLAEISQLETWCQRAQQVLEEYEWLSWYATPVE